MEILPNTTGHVTREKTHNANMYEDDESIFPRNYPFKHLIASFILFRLEQKNS